MPIPKELYCTNIPEYTKQEEVDYKELTDVIVRGLRSGKFPFQYELRAKRCSKRPGEFTLIDVNLEQSAIDRVSQDVRDAGYLVTITNLDVKSLDTGESVRFQSMLVAKPKPLPKPDLPPAYVE